MTAPRYQEVKAPDIPEITDDDGTTCGWFAESFWGKTGPVDGIAADPIYLDVSVPPGDGRRCRWRPRVTRSPMFLRGAGNSAMLRVRWRCRPKACGWPDTKPPTEADNRSLVLFDRGDEVTVQAGEDGIRFLLVSGKPLEEPVAWYGPIVMNTQEQLQQAFQELEEGTFLKK